MYELGLDDCRDVLLPLFTGIKHLDFSHFQIRLWPFWDPCSRPHSVQLRRLLEYLCSSISTLEFSVDHIEPFSIIISESSCLKTNLRLRNIILKPTGEDVFHLFISESDLSKIEKNFKRILGHLDEGEQVAGTKGTKGRVIFDVGQIGIYQTFTTASDVLGAMCLPAVELGGSSMLLDDDAFASRREVSGELEVLEDEVFASP